MHFLATILIKEEDLKSRSDEYIRNLAVESLDEFHQIAFDWRASDAGRWKDDYPNNVLRASDDVEKNVSVLNDLIAERNAELSFHLESMKKQNSTDLESIVNKYIKNNGLYDMPYHHLVIISSILADEFGVDNRFLNTDSGDANLTQEVIEEIKQNPENYALVFFDCHW